MANTFIFDDEDQPDMGSPLPDQGDDDDQAPEEGEGNNRIFIMILIGIGIFALLAILCIAGVFLFRPGGPLNKGDLAATDVFTTQQAFSLQASQTAALASPTLSSSVDMTETPTATSVVFIPVTETVSTNLEPTNDPATATFEALQTQLVKSQAQTTATFIAKSTPATTRTATPQIPKTGFADEVGLPGLVIAALILLGIILLARRLRAAPAR